MTFYAGCSMFWVTVTFLFKPTLPLCFYLLLFFKRLIKIFEGNFEGKSLWIWRNWKALNGWKHKAKVKLLCANKLVDPPANSPVSWSLTGPMFHSALSICKHPRLFQMLLSVPPHLLSPLAVTSDLEADLLTDPLAAILAAWVWHNRHAFLLLSGSFPDVL